MPRVKMLYNFLDAIFGSVWALMIVDIIQTSNEVLHSVDGWFKVLMSFVGLIYFVMMIPHKIKMQSLDRAIKKQELEKITKENDKKDV